MGSKFRLNTPYKKFFILVLIFILSRVFLVKYLPSNIVSFSLLNQAGILLVSFLNSYLIYLIAVKKISEKYAIWASFIYLICPWVFYYELFGSVYLIYLSIFMSLYLLYLSKNRWSLLMVVLIILLLLQFKSKDYFYSEVGLVNAVNVFRGEAQLEGFDLLSKIIENRYVYYSLTLVNKTLAISDPLVYFSPQARELPFINTPPIWLGLLPMFLIGLWQILNKHRDVFYLTVGAIPGIMFIKIYDFEKLILFLPFILLSIIFGIKKLDQQKRLFRILIYTCTFLVILQLLVFVPDYIFREQLRFQLLK